jgi:hypothetical protein
MNNAGCRKVWNHKSPTKRRTPVTNCRNPGDDARHLLDDGLTMSLRAGSTVGVTMSLAAFARLVLVEGAPDRAAVIFGAAEGLRRRVGVRVWPTLRRGETELVEQLQHALGAERFQEAFATGSRLSRREAVAFVRGRSDGA